MGSETWRWISEAVILALHDEQLAEHGGKPGVRDIGLLQSALARPLNRAAYDEATIYDLAASYAFGIVRNHPFVDGNKRVALLAAALFLLDHDVEITASDADTVASVLQLADGTMSEAKFVAWLQANSTPAAD